MTTARFDLEVPMSVDPDAEAMAAIGRRALDMIVAHRSGLGDKPVHRHKARAHLNTHLAEPPPRTGMPTMDVLDLVEREVLSALSHTDHPRFFGFVPGASSFLGVVGDTLAAGFNVFAGHTFVGAGATAIEGITLSWLRELVHFPDTAAGLFVSGGSMANLTAFHAARTAAIGADRGHDETLVVYGSDQQHSSVLKALRILGFSRSQLKVLRADSRWRLDPVLLEQSIVHDKSNGLRPFLVAAAAGSTSVGAVDPLADIRRICDTHGLWMHVDGAYGAAAYLDDRARGTLHGMEQADSLTIDPHKWWFQPYEIGCVLVRDGSHLKRAFSMEAEYLREASAASAGLHDDPLAGDLNFYDLGPQLTRSFRALKLWLFLKVNGVDRLATLVARGIALGEATQALIEASGCWEIVSPASLGILTFRHRNEELRDPAIVQAAIAALLRTGFALITSTEIREETVFRLCLINPASILSDIAKSLDLLDAALQQAETAERT